MESVVHVLIGSSTVESIVLDFDQELLGNIDKHGGMVKPATTKEFWGVKEQLRKSGD